MNRPSFATLTLGWLILHLAGCALPGGLRFSKDHFPKSGPKNPVVRILGIWQPSEGMWQGKTTRGFTGQIMFFGQNNDAPVQVDGEVRFFVFDDQGDPEEQAKPLHQHDYPAPTWKAMLAPGPLGATYHVFIPYTRPGIHEANCTLRIRYIPASGHAIPVYSEMVNITLAGAKKRNPASTGVNVDEVPGGLPSPDGADSSSPPPEVSDRNAPRARGLSEPVPAQDELQKLLPRKPQAVELTEAERQRILREARARLKSGEDSRVSHVAYEESDTDDSRTRRKPSRRKSVNPVQAADTVAEEDDDQRSPSANEDPSDASTALTGDDAQHAEEDDADAGDETSADPAYRARARKMHRAAIDLEAENDSVPRHHLLED